MEVGSHQPARFFKIILPSTITPHKLRIPPKFVDKYGDELSNVVKLIDLVDATWYVKLEKAENKVWFHDGWKKFFDDHSIGYFYFLLFEYIGNSSFNVHIFDLTATEVDCQINNCNFGADDNITMEENSDDDSVQIIDSIVAKPDGIQHGSKRVDSMTSEVDYPTNGLDFTLDENTKMEENSDDDSVQIFDSFDAKPDGKLRHENPSFRSSLKPYNVSKGLPLYVPEAFVEYLPSLPHHFELHDSYGKKWMVDVSRRKNGRVYFGCSRWRRVMEEKRLALGDTCVFELIDVNKCMLKVLRAKRRAVN